MRELVLGGARSGKSGYALRRARESGLPVLFIVTAQARDAEMAERIAKHRAERPGEWQVIEAPLDLPDAIARADASPACIVVDCLTLWLSNLMCEPTRNAAAAADELIEAASRVRNSIHLVSNEVGWGIVPDNALARAFRDEAGRLHQRLAEVCERVTLVVAGLPLSLKT